MAELPASWVEAAAPARELWEAAFSRSDDPLSPAAPIDVPDLRGQLKHAPGYFDIPRFAECVPSFSPRPHPHTQLSRRHVGLRCCWQV